MKVFTRILCVVVCLTPWCFVNAAKPEIKEKRINGSWEVHCKSKLPEQAEKLYNAIGQLRTQCEIAALRLAVKEHSRHGASPKAILSKEKINKKKKTISVVARLSKP